MENDLYRMTHDIIMESERRDIAFVLFINSVSGSNTGREYLSIEAEEISFRVRNQPNVHVFMYDLFEQESRTKGMEKVKENVDRYDMRVVICGGDGSVLWVVKEVIEAGVDIHKIVFGIIPIGTGNDFSRTLGWLTTAQFSDCNLGGLKGIVKEWLRADIRSYDIWDFEMEMWQGGDIKRIKNKAQVMVEERPFKRSFSNYFGIGIDARIGYSFDRRRTKKRLLNLLCYGCIGLFKWCRPSVHMDELIDTMQEHNESGREEIQSPEEKDQGPRMMETEAEKQMREKQEKLLVFHSDRQAYGKKNSLKSGFKNILCLNSTSFMGGASNIWETEKSAIHDSSIRQFKKQDYGDGILQFVSFESELQLGLERYVSGRSSKLTQGKGPFTLNFKKPTEIPRTTYLQIDGQFWKIRNPKSITVKKTGLIDGSQIRVMVRRQ